MKRAEMNLKETPRFIHFFGPDGAGKSTQVELLANTLKKRGVPVRKVWIRSSHTLAFLISTFFLKIGFYRVVLNPFGFPLKLPAVNSNRLLRYIWSVTEFISVLPLILLQVSIPLRRGYTLVAERYVLDTIVRIAYLLDDITFLRSPLSKVLLHFIPTGTILIYLDSDFETIVQRRWHLIGRHNPPRNLKRGYGALPRHVIEPRDYIKFQRAAYKVLAKSFNALEIDTSKSDIAQTSRLILHTLDSSTINVQQ